MKNIVMARIEQIGNVIKYLMYNRNVRYNIMDTETTLKYIKENRVSMGRYGDGEMGLFWGIGIGFQRNNEELVKRLAEVSRSKRDDFIIGLPDTFNRMNLYNLKGRWYWINFIGNYAKRIQKLFDKNMVYGNANCTRFYTAYKNKDCKHTVELFKSIWDKRNILIIEGEKSRIGVGNDLFDNAKSIRRILCPAVNAFSRYEEIFEEAKKTANKDDLIIMALGPTATVLAYDLACAGYQALDLGHIDIQYEYFLRKAKSKMAIEGKFVNEAGGGT